MQVVEWGKVMNWEGLTEKGVRGSRKTGVGRGVIGSSGMEPAAF